MKRYFSLLPLIVLTVLVLLSCDTNRETTVVNDSNRPITFQWSGYDDNKITLNPRESITSEYLHADLFDLQPEKRVSQQRSQNTITVSNLPSWEVRVNNTLGYPVTLTAGGWMEDMINIPPGGEHSTGVIFTDKPVFSVSTGSFPATAQYQIVDNIMYVTIK
jgi:hypothetical protein